MDQKILVFAGKKQSGKSSAANFVTGYTITQLARTGLQGLPKYFTIREDGELIVSTKIIVDDETVLGHDVLDLRRTDEEYVNWASHRVWPYVKTYAFADMLKVIATTIFNVPAQAVYGTDEDKKQLTDIKWKNMCAFLPPRQVSDLKKSEKYNKKMTAREFLQYFGTNICRKLYEECWTGSCLRQIAVDCANLAIIDDCRFDNEVKAARAVGAKVIRLGRVVEKDLHASETGLDKMHHKNFDLTIGPDVTIKEKNQLILEAMYKWGWFDKHVEVDS